MNTGYPNYAAQGFQPIGGNPTTLQDVKQWEGNLQIDWSQLRSVPLPTRNGRTVLDLGTYLDNNAVFCPLDYGAVGDGTTDDTLAVQECLAQAALYAGTEDVLRPTTVDLKGRRYKISAQLEVPANAGLLITEGRLVAADTLPSTSYLLATGRTSDASLRDGFKVNNLRLYNVFFDNRHRGGGLYLARYNRAVVDSCTFIGYETVGLKTAIDGHEAFIVNSQFGEYVWGDMSGTGYNNSAAFVGTGMEIGTNDNHILSCNVALSKVGLKITKQANFIHQLHVWTGYVSVVHPTDPNYRVATQHTTGIWLAAGANYNTFTGCYIDGCKFVIEDPYHTTITNCLFLHGAGGPDVAFIHLKPMGAGRHLSGLNIRNNLFRNGGKDKMKGMVVDTSAGGSFSGSNIRGCDVEGNAFSGTQFFAFRVRTWQYLQNATTWTIDIASLIPAGLGAYIRQMQWSVQGENLGTQTFKHKSVAGTVATFEASAAAYATIHLDASICDLDA